MRQTVYRWFEDNRWAGDLALFGLLLVLSLLVDGLNYGVGERWLLISAAALSPLLWRRTRPETAVLLGVVTMTAHLVLLPGPTVLVAVVPILVHTAALRLPPNWRRGTLITAGFGALLGPFRWTDGSGASSLIVMAALCAVIVLVAYMIGERQRTRAERELVDRARDDERATLLQTQEQQRTQMTLAAERARIARELHDIVAHSLSVVIVQAQGARAAVDAKPELAGPVLDTIAETGRAALAEMRTLVGVLRGGDEGAADGGAEDAPAQGVADLPDLVDTIRTSGVPVELEITGGPATLPPGLDLTVYRLVQESLTNVLKHGGPGVRATVDLQFWDGLLQVDVLDDGRGAAAPASDDGHGLIGMRERVQAMGGQVTAQPRTGGGFAVRARFPLTAHPGAAGSVKQ